MNATRRFLGDWARVGVVILACLALVGGIFFARGALGTARQGALAATAITPAPSAVVRVGSNLAIVATKNPRSVLSVRIAKATGSNCLRASTGYRDLSTPAGLDQLVSAAGGDGHRIKELGDAWIGDEVSVLAAYEATWAGRTANEPQGIWIERQVDGKPAGLELLMFQTSRGETVWIPGDVVMSAPCDPTGE